MNWIKQKILGLLRVELDAAYQMLRDERDSHKSTKSYCKYLSNEYDRMKEKNDNLLEIAEHWRKEANAKQQLFSDIVREVDGAENLHNLKQIVREMAFRNESYGAILCRPGEEPKVIVTDERVI